MVSDCHTIPLCVLRMFLRAFISSAMHLRLVCVLACCYAMPAKALSLKFFPPLSCGMVYSRAIMPAGRLVRSAVLTHYTDPFMKPIREQFWDAITDPTLWDRWNPIAYVRIIFTIKYHHVVAEIHAAYMYTSRCGKKPCSASAPLLVRKYSELENLCAADAGRGGVPTGFGWTGHLHLAVGTAAGQEGSIGRC